MLLENRLLALSARRRGVALICEQYFRRFLFEGFMMGSTLSIAKKWMGDILSGVECIEGVSDCVDFAFPCVFGFVQCAILFSSVQLCARG